jgi:glutamine synthetase
VTAEPEPEAALDDVETVLVAFTDHYGRLCGKRYDGDFFRDEIAKGGAHACDYLLTTDMELEPVPGYRFANWQAGYGDMHLVPDLATARRLSWLESTALVLCDIEGTAIAPRSILRRQADAAARLGFTAMAGTELEFYVMRTSYADAAANNYTGLQPAGWYLEDYQLLQGARVEPFIAAVRRHLKQSGVPVENSKGEWGLGQHEVNVRYTDALGMADRHVVYKQCVKEVADQQGLSATFMAKPWADRAGSSCHVHLSLWRGDEAAFSGAAFSDAGAETDEFRWFLGGLLAHAADVTPFLAPTVNSAKRYADESWAPTRLAWSRDNRTAGFRVVGSGPSLRVECRIPGADCNPYLALAALLACGLQGVRDQAEPPPEFRGDAYQADDLPLVPRTLRHATDLFAASAFCTNAFGPEVVEHYTHFFRTEQAAFDAAVTDWERQRYYERI